MALELGRSTQDPGSLLTSSGSLEREMTALRFIHHSGPTEAILTVTCSAQDVTSAPQSIRPPENTVPELPVPVLWDLGN